MNTLDHTRRELDAVDTQIISLLEKRLALTEVVADWKNSQQGVPYTDTTREGQILEKLRAHTVNPILQDGITDVYGKLFHMSKNIRHLRAHPQSPYRQVGIIGDGLIGRSIANIIQAKNNWYPHDEVRCTIKNHDWNPHDFSTCDLIIIATPIESVCHIATQLAESGCLMAGCTIVDVASVKGDIAQRFSQLAAAHPSYHLIPTHPMGGSQASGKYAAQTSLFAGRPWVVVPIVEGEGALQKLEGFIQYAGSVVVRLDASEHDRLVASISHMPGLVSRALLDFVQTHDPKAITIAGSGFELMTKIGKTTNTRMRTQISRANHDHIKNAVRAFADYLHSHLSWTS